MLALRIRSGYPVISLRPEPVSTTPVTHIALLRGINVGAKHTLAMRMVPHAQLGAMAVQHRRDIETRADERLAVRHVTYAANSHRARRYLVLADERFAIQLALHGIGPAFAKHDSTRTIGHLSRVTPASWSPQDGL